MCLDASVSGLEPYVEIVNRPPCATCIAFIIVQHHAPTMPHLLPISLRLDGFMLISA